MPRILEPIRPTKPRGDGREPTGHRASASPLLALVVVLIVGWVARAAPPPPGRVPPNASSVSASVLAYSAWPPPSGEETVAPVVPGRPLYSVRLEIHTADATASGLPSLARPGLVVDAFWQDPRARNLVGKRIRATLTL